jgi:hypothetical protein
MKTRITLLTIFAVFLPMIAANADTVPAESGMGGKSIDTILSEIRSEQGIGPSDRIDPGKVPDTLLEQLGEAATATTMEWVPGARQAA